MTDVTYYKHVGNSPIDTNAWPDAAKKDADGNELYTFSGDTSGTANGASPEWVVESPVDEVATPVDDTPVLVVQTSTVLKPWINITVGATQYSDLLSELENLVDLLKTIDGSAPASYSAVLPDGGSAYIDYQLIHN